MNARQRFSVFAICLAPSLIAQAQTAEPIATRKYIVHTIVLPFDSRLIGIDDAGDLAGAFGSRWGGFIFRPGDESIEPWTAPLAPDSGVVPVAMNDHGEVVVSIVRSENGMPQSQAQGYIYSAREKTYRPFAFHQQTRGCAPTIAYNDAGQMFCGDSTAYSTAYISVPTLGPAGSFDDPGGTASTSSFSCPDKAIMAARGENNRGQLVGYCLASSFDPATRQSTQWVRGFVYDVPTKSMKLFDYPGSTHTTAEAITDTGVVVGAYAAGSESGVFAYDGSHFTRLEGTDANAPDKKVSMAAERYIINSRGEIVGVLRATGRAFIAVPVGQAPPRVAEDLDEGRVAKLRQDAFRQKPGSGKSEDPNFPIGPGGQGEYFGRGFLLKWGSGGLDRTLSAVMGTAPGQTRYVGFNDRGSWFTAGAEGLPYRWNLQSKSLAFLLTAFPANLKLPAEPTAPPSAQAAPVVPAAPTHGDQGKLTHAADGNAYLSYVLPGTPPTPMNLKVVRPTNTKPAILTPARIGAGDTGSWVFFGEGAQQAIAALVNLEADGTVTWQFLTPAMAHKYLEP